MKNYYEAMDEDVFDNLPLTFHIKTGFDDPEFKRFEQIYKKIDEDIKLKKQRKKENLENIQNQATSSPMQSPSKKEINA